MDLLEARAAKAASLMQSHSKDQLAQMARAAGWSGDDARTPKSALAEWLAEHGEKNEGEQQQAKAQGAKTITARFPGKCAHCSGAIQKGETIAYSKAQHKAWHVNCYDGTQDAEAATATEIEHDSGGKAPEAKNANAVAAAIAAALASVKLGVDPDEVRAIVAEQMKPVAAMLREEVRQSFYTVEVKLPDREAKNVGRQHKTFPKLLKMVAAGVNVFMAGPAGSGKTTAAEKCAEALDVPFYFNGAIDSEYKLMGFVDAQGRIISTAFRKAFTEGGVYLFDEVDASLPAALLAFNAALSNGHRDFPGADRPVSRHPDFRCIAAGNTWGYGANVEYVGRNRMDAAFMDRFAKLEWTYDEALERALAGNDDWTSYVQGLRVKAKAQGLKVVISPRASINGAKLIAAGLTQKEAAECTVFFGLTPEQRKNLEA